MQFQAHFNVRFHDPAFDTERNGVVVQGIRALSTRAAEPPDHHRNRALLDYPYGFAARFGDDRRGTYPDELLGAAHAACFTMVFSFACEKAGFATATVDTQAHVHLPAQGDGFVIDRIALHLRAAVPGLEEVRFQTIAAAAKRDCPLNSNIKKAATANRRGF